MAALIVAASFSSRAYAGELQNWLNPPVSQSGRSKVSSEPAKAIVVAAAKDFQKLRQDMRVFRSKEFVADFERAVTLRQAAPQSFSAEFPDIAARGLGGRLVFHVFAPDGVYLFASEFRAADIPDYRFLRRVEVELAEYAHYKNGGGSQRAPLYWPNRAYQSGQYRLGLQYLERIKRSSLSEAELAAYFKLLELCSAKLPPSSP